MTLLAVDWKGFPALAREGSASGLEGRLEAFRSLIADAAGRVEASFIEHPIKGRDELRILAFGGATLALETALALPAALSQQGFEAALALHAGECFRRENTYLGAPIREVAALAQQGDAGAVLLTEVFRLTVPAGALPKLARQEKVYDLAGNGWTVYRVEGAKA